MYNNEALKLSEENIKEQCDFVLDSYPFIREVYPVNNVSNMRADYLAGVDAVGVCSDGSTRTIQMKARKAGNRDLIIPAIRLCGKAALDGDIGFIFDGEKYAFTPKADVFVEKLNMRNYTFTKEELLAIEAMYPEDLYQAISSIRPKYLYDDKGNAFPSGEYYVFIAPYEMLALQTVLFNIMHGKLE